MVRKTSVTAVRLPSLVWAKIIPGQTNASHFQMRLTGNGMEEKQTWHNTSKGTGGHCSCLLELEKVGSTLVPVDTSVKKKEVKKKQGWAVGIGFFDFMD